MDYTMLIAVIGCVTGIASLLIEAAQFFAGRSKAKFDTFDELNNFIYMEEFVVEDDDRSEAGKVVHCFLNLRVMNTGGRHILIQDVYMIRPGGKKNERKDRAYPYGAYEKTPWKYCNGSEIAMPEKIHLPASIPAGGLFEATFAFADFEAPCYMTDEYFVYPVLCVVMADGSVKEVPIQSILYKSDSFKFVDSVNDKEYSMGLNDDGESLE